MTESNVIYPKEFQAKEETVISYSSYYGFYDINVRVTLDLGDVNGS